MKLTVAKLFAGVGGFRVGLNNIEQLLNSKAVENCPWKFIWITLQGLVQYQDQNLDLEK